MIYIFWTCKNQNEAESIIRALLEKHLIACASILPEIKSIYRWEGKIEEGIETKVILKTQAKHFEMIEEYIKNHCSYSVPEILQVAIEKGHSNYLAWVLKETTS